MTSRRKPGQTPAITDIPPLDQRRDDELLRPWEVALYLNVEVPTLGKWRKPTDGRQPRGPAYVTLSTGPKSPVRYRAATIKQWLAPTGRAGQQRRNSPAA